MDVTRHQVMTAALGALVLSTAITCAVFLRKSAGELAALGERVAKLESASAAGSTVSSRADLKKEIERLRRQIESLARGGNAGDPRGTGEAPPVDSARNPDPGPSGTNFRESEAATSWASKASKGTADRLDRALGLSESQFSMIEQILVDEFLAYRQARKSGDSERSAEAGAALDEAARARIRPLLTADQQVKYDQLAARPGGIWSTPVGQAGEEQTIEGWNTKAKPK